MSINAHPAEPEKPKHSCPCCGGRMVNIESFEPGETRTIGQARQRLRSGSTPHDPITADQQPLPDLFLPTGRPPQPSSPLSSEFAGRCLCHPAAQPAAHPFAPSCSSGLDRKISTAPVAPSPRQHRRPAETSIAFLAAPLSCGTEGPLSLAAISCLGAFQPPVARARG